MRALRITVPASQDLEEISDYFLRKSIDAGDRFITTFSQQCQHIAQFPYIGKSYDFIKPGLRGLLVMGYIVFYRVSDTDIEILRVVSGYRDLKNVFSS